MIEEESGLYFETDGTPLPYTCIFFRGKTYTTDSHGHFLHDYTIYVLFYTHNMNILKIKMLRLLSLNEKQNMGCDISMLCEMDSTLNDINYNSDEDLRITKKRKQANEDEQGVEEFKIETIHEYGNLNL